MEVLLLKGLKKNSTDNNKDSSLIFGTSTGGLNAVERMRIDSSGKVGIGDNDPGTLSLSGSDRLFNFKKYYCRTY